MAHNQALTIEEKAKAFDDICEMFSIGKNVRKPSILKCSIDNVIRFADQLAAIEQKFFMVAGEPDDREPDEEPEDECLLNRWGSTTDEYVSQFADALLNIEPFKTLTSEKENLIEQRSVLQQLLYSYVISHPKPTTDSPELNDRIIDALSFGSNLREQEAECPLSLEKAIQKIERKHPQAHYQGFLNEKQPLLRDALTEKVSFHNQIGLCLRWFNENTHAKPINRSNPHATLGTLKHQVEKFLSETNKHHIYIPRGAVLVAAVMLGYEHTNDKLHISSRALKFGTTL